MISILDAACDRHLFAPWFKNREHWAAWFAFLAALFAIEMTEEQASVYRACTGREALPTTAATEAWLAVGRRGGKSFVLAMLAVFIACFRDCRQFLAPGERGTIMVIARDRQQARIILRYIRALLRVPLLAQMIERETAEAFDLDNQITIEVHVASFRSTRGYSIVAALCDEIAFWPTDDAAEPDFEIINALRPGMAQFPNSLLLCASSPYARRGALWDAHRRHFGRDADPVLVWQAPTRVMNPTIPQALIDQAYERDPASASAEFGAEFRSDVESFINLEAVQACISRGTFERQPRTGLRYLAFTDPSGGSSDSFTLAIAHRENDSLILDCIREIKPPFSPEAAIAEFASTCRSYRISRIVGDRYAGEFPREQFRKHGISYDVSNKSKSDLYLDLLPLLNSRRAELLDNPRLAAQLIALERRTARSGRESIDHPPGAHDDLANAVAGVLASNLAVRSGLRMFTYPVVGSRPGCEIDPKTMRPIERERIRWLKVN